MNTLLTGNQMRDITRNLGRGNAEIALCRAQEAETKRLMARAIRERADMMGMQGIIAGLELAAEMLEEG